MGDPGGEDTEANLLQVSGKAAGVSFSLIVGKTQSSSAPGARSGRYARFPGQQQALLVSGKLDIRAEISAWIDSNLLNVGPDRVQKVTITHADGSRISLVRDLQTGDMNLQGLAEDKEPKDPIVLNRMKEVLSSLRIEDVRRGNAQSLTDEVVITEVATQDGLLAFIHSAPIDGTTWVHFHFAQEDRDTAAPGPSGEGQAAEGAAGDNAGEEPDIQAEIAQLNGRTEDWLFKLPDYQLELLTRKLDRLSQDKVTPASEEG